MASSMERGLASLIQSILVKHKSRHSIQMQLRKINSLMANNLSASASSPSHLLDQTKATLCISASRLSSTGSEVNVVRSPFPDIEITSETIPEFIWKDIESVGEAPFIVDAEKGRGYSYGGARAVSKKFAAALVKSGFKPGDVISLVLPNLPEFPLVLLGALEAGLVVTTTNPIYTAHEVSHQLSNSGARCIVTLPSLIPVCKKAMEKLKTEMPIITLSYDEAKASGTWDFQDMVSANVDTSIIPQGCTRSEDIALIPYSSGTTGLSKGVCLTHRNVTSNILMLQTPGVPSYRSSQPTSEHQDVVFGVLPFFHSYGLNALLLSGVKSRVKIVSFPKFDPATYLKQLKTQKPRSTICPCAPPLTLFLGLHPAVTPEHLESVRIIFNGAGPVGLTDIERLLEKNSQKDGFKVYNAYGLTETSPVATVPFEDNTSLESVGCPTASSQIRIVSESGTNLGPNENGELHVKGPHVMKGYYKNEDATREAIDADGWFRTGDMGYYDAEGRFFVVERLKELIKVKGFQVPPAELEAILRSHPDVADAAVIGVPDARTGEKPVAFIVSKPGKTANEDQIKEFVGEQVAPYKQIREIKELEAIPKNLTGKILRRILKEEYLKQNP